MFFIFFNICLLLLYYSSKLEQNKSLLIIGKVWPEPNSSAAGTRMMQLINLFQKLGYHITFASAAKESSFQFDLKQLNISIQKIELNSVSFDDFIAKLNPGVVIFDRFLTEEQFGWRVIEQCPNAFRILNTEDLHFLRRARKVSIKNTGDLSSVNLRTEDAVREISSIYRSDLTLLVSDFEQDLLCSEFNIPHSILFYLPLFAQKNTELKPSFEERDGFIFIGNYNHEPNLDALCFLKEVIWPKIKIKIPNVVLNVYGAYPSKKVLDFNKPDEHFIVHGRVENAMDVTLSSRVSLAPLRFGAGIKGKLIEAMIAGTPSVTTSIGVEGIAFKENWCGIATDNIDDFVSGAVSLYEDEKLWNKYHLRGFEIIEERFKAEIYFEGFEKRLIEIQNDIESHRKQYFIQQLVQHQTLMSNRFLSKWIEEKNK